MKIYFKEDFDLSCLKRELKLQAPKHFKSPLDFAIYDYFYQWFNNAKTVGERIKRDGVPVTYTPPGSSENRAKDINTGHIINDLLRLIPKVEGFNLDPINHPHASTGYCKSLAENILKFDYNGSRKQMFRIFESKDFTKYKGPESYKVFWLSEGRLIHILNRHSYSSISAVKDNKDQFKYDDQIIITLKNSILNSTSNNRGRNPNSSSSNATAFQTKFVNKIDKFDITNVLQTITSEREDRKIKDHLYRIETTYPLNMRRKNAKSIDGGPIP